MTSKILRAACVAALAALALPLPAMAQGYDPDYGYDRPPPPRPRLPDDGYGFRPPPPPPPPGYDGGYRRPAPYSRYGEGGGGLVCRTEEGTCAARGPQFFRARCLCDFGDGPVRGRMKP